MRRALAVLAAGVLAAGPAQATLLLPASLEELVGRSDCVLIGRVTSVAPRMRADGRDVETLVVIAPERFLKGNAPGDVTLAVPGGRMGDRVRVYLGAPRFSRGERVFVFASAGADGAPLTVTGFSLGKFGVVMDPATGAELALRDLPAEGPRATGGRTGPAAIRLDELVHAVEEVVAGRPSPIRLKGRLEPRARAPVDLVINPALDPEARGPAARTAGIPESDETGPEPGPRTLGALAVGGLCAAGLGACAAFLALVRRRRRAGAAVLGIAVALAGAGLLGTRALAYTRLRANGSSGPFVWWDTSSGPVVWYMDANETFDCDGELEAVQAAFDAWLSIENCDMPFEYGGAVPPSATRDFADDGANVVFWAGGALLDPAVLALTAWSADAFTGELLDVDVGFNGTFHTWTVGIEDLGMQPVWGVAEHEVGHFAGLGHNAGDTASTMYPYFHTGLATLSPDDVAGARALYPDVTPPAPPVIATSGGLDFTTANATLVLKGTAAADAVGVSVNGSASGVVLVGDAWRYQTQLALGTHRFQVRAADAAGNASAPATIYVTRTDGGLSIERFVLRDLSTAAAGATNADRVEVDVSVRSSSAVVGYLLSEDPSLAPDAAYVAANGTPAPPVVASFADRTECVKRLYLWVADSGGNVAGPAYASTSFDWQHPILVAAECVDATHVRVEFSEPVLGGLDPANYLILGGATCTGAALVDGWAAVLTTTALTPGAGYTLVAGPGITDEGGANTVPAAGVSFVARDDPPAVAAVHSRTFWRSTVTFGEPVLGALARSSWAVGSTVFDAAAWPYEVAYLGGDTYELHHYDAYVDTTPDGYDAPLLVGNVRGLSGAALDPNGAGPWHEETLSVRSSADRPPDPVAPVVGAFSLRSLMNPANSATTTRPAVGVRAAESDADGGVVRWLLTEDMASTPTPAEVRASGLARRPVSFELSDVPGPHAVRLWIVDDDGNIASADSAIDLLANAPPVAAITPPSSPDFEAPATIAFDASGSVDPEGSGLEYYWDFGDGGASREPSPVHSYPRVGTYEVTLVVTDDQGRTGIDTLVVDVRDDTPPDLEVTRLSFRGRVDSAAVTQVRVEVDGVPQVAAPVVAGAYAVDVDLPAGAVSLTLVLYAEDGALVTSRTVDVSKGP
jgi:PKD repeat protein